MSEERALSEREGSRRKRFDGFPERALIFYEGLEADNSKPYWTDHKAVYEECVQAPMLALLAELEPEFGAAKFFRPYRDVRFAKDKTPYKTNAAPHRSATARAPGCTCRCPPTASSSAAATTTPRRTRSSGCGGRSPTTCGVPSWSGRWPRPARRASTCTATG